MDISQHELPTILRYSEQQLIYAHYELETSYFEFNSYDLTSLQSLSDNLSQIGQTYPYLHETNHSIEVICDTLVTLVPLSLFQEEQCDAIYNLCFSPNTPHRVFYDSIGTSGIILLFGLPESVCQTIEAHFKRVHYTSKHTLLTRHLSQRGGNMIPKHRLFCILSPSHIDLLVFEGKQVLFINQFEVQNTTDEAYYTFNVAQKLNLNLQEDEIYVVGTSEQRSTTIDMFKQFSSKVYPVNPPADFNRHIISQHAQVPYDLMIFFCA